MNCKIIYVCSPCQGIQENIQYAKERCNELIRLGYIPIAPHVFYTQFLSDQIPEERAQALEAGLELVKRCDIVYVYGDVITEGMRGEIDLAVKLSIPVKYVS